MGSSAASTAQAAPQTGLTFHSWLVAAVGLLGGISFGYENSIVSGLIVQPSFLHFFDSSDRISSSITASHAQGGSSYCKLNSIFLQLYISGLFVVAAAATACSIAGIDRWGRRTFIILGSALVLAACCLQTAASGQAMLIAGRFVMGLGQGFATFTVPMYIAEMAPAAVRGRFGAVYSISTTIGQALNNGISHAVYVGGAHEGWRASFAAAAWCPLLMLLLMVFVLPDSPSSLLQRRRVDDARRAFNKIRPHHCLQREQEWQGMVDEADRIQHVKLSRRRLKMGQIPQQQYPQKQCRSCQVADAAAAVAATADEQFHNSGCSGAESSWPKLCLQEGGPPVTATATSDVVPVDLAISLDRSTHAVKAKQVQQQQEQDALEEPPRWPAYIITFHLTAMRCWNGYVAVMFFAAVLFSSTGNSVSMSLVAQTLLGSCTVFGGFVAMAGIDKFGRQPLLIWFSLLMAVSMAAAGAILGAGLPPSAVAAGKTLSPLLTGLLLGVLCLWQLGYWSSWAPCFYVMMSELYPLERRATAVGCGMVLFNLAVFSVLFAGGHMLCHMTYGLMVFYAAIDLYLALFAALCMPETKGMSLQAVGELYRRHWLWKHSYGKRL